MGWIDKIRGKIQDPEMQQKVKDAAAKAAAKRNGTTGAGVAATRNAPYYGSSAPVAYPYDADTNYGQQDSDGDGLPDNIDSSPYGDPNYSDPSYNQDSYQDYQDTDGDLVGDVDDPNSYPDTSGTDQWDDNGGSYTDDSDTYDAPLDDSSSYDSYDGGSDSGSDSYDSGSSDSFSGE